jgi:hypothetical protein
VRPRITIWFHQPLGLIDLSGGETALERRFAGLVGLPVLRLTRYPGSAVGWENQRLPGSTAFVVELPPGALSKRDTARYADAVRRLAGAPNLQRSFREDCFDGCVAGKRATGANS